MKLKIMPQTVACIVLSLLFLYRANAQTVQRCASTEYSAHLYQQDPRNRTNWEAVEAYTQKWIKTHRDVKSMGEVYTIPVVVHVVYTEDIPETNVSEEQIYSQIEALTEDFRRMNADTNLTPDEFLPVAADIEVEFCIAHKDPEGYPTTGITRTPTDKEVFNVSSNDVKSFASGGADGWPSNRYLNMWVCNSISNDDGDEILGYAQFPAEGPVQYDGVVIAHYAFGRTGSVSPIHDKGRTATHEVGHWLNLIHIWGDKDLPLGTEPSCFTDDLVADTPLSDEANFGCPTTNSCANESPDYNDMIQNYMDYSNDNCLNLFTLGQKQRMRAILEPGGVRNSLVSQPDICGVGENDASALSIIAPYGTGICTTFEPVIELVNSGSGTLYYVDIQYSVDNGAPISTYWIGELPPFEWVNITLPPLNTITPGIIHSFTVTYSNPNGVADFNIADNSKTVSFATVPKGADLPFAAGFETGGFPATGWQVINPGSNTTFALYSGAGNSGSFSVYIENVNYNATGAVDEFTLPRVDLDEVNPKLEFYQAYALKTAADVPDTLEILVSTDCGTTFTSAYKITNEQLITALNPISASFVPASTNWRRHEVSLWDFKGTRSAVIKFRQVRGTGNNLFIDDINVFAGNTSVIPAANTLLAGSMRLAPNPANNHAILRFTGSQTAPGQVSVFSLSGQVVWQNAIQVNNGENSFQLPAAQWLPGIYAVRLTVGNQTVTQKLSVVR